jgi:hypothetical protein
MKTFTCNFGSGITCTIQVSNTPPAKGTQPIHACVWTGKPGPAILRPYIAWMNGVNARLADEWRIKLMHVYQTGPASFEAWSYEPGKPAKRVDILTPQEP